MRFHAQVSGSVADAKALNEEEVRALFRDFVGKLLEAGVRFPSINMTFSDES